ncbi:MAG: hypothetical protein IPI42_14580 [Saprospiraceae bacterium]|nr:MAG: hypothetical protein UZ08_BCD001002747 [Candidatus Parvibacillus calidus]MBK7741723.1 hypothetical protein [Candidatus Parvibacillus calidus]WKZ63800.1 MAG: hypothetical protein QY315_03200 [Saprospiraceae bacterium]
MKFIKIIIVSFIPFLLTSQNLPSDSKVLEDVKKYHGKIATAKVQNEWKLEKEPGYTFSNMAKRVVAATTVKENNITKNLIGLAIYVRGGSGEKWNFSRYFVTSSQITGLAPLNEQQIKDQTIQLLRSNPGRVFVNFSDIAWVYDLSFPEGLKSETDRTGDIIYKAQIEYEQKFISSYPFEGGLRKYKSPLEIYVRPIDGVLKVAVASLGYSDPIKETLMTEKQYNALIVLGQKPFDELYGTQGPSVSGNTKSEGENEAGKSKSNNNSEKKGIKMPVIKLKN